MAAEEQHNEEGLEIDDILSDLAAAQDDTSVVQQLPDEDDATTIPASSWKGKKKIAIIAAVAAVGAIILGLALGVNLASDDKSVSASNAALSFEDCIEELDTYFPTSAPGAEDQALSNDGLVETFENWEWNSNDAGGDERRELRGGATAGKRRVRFFYICVMCATFDLASQYSD